MSRELPDAIRKAARKAAETGEGVSPPPALPVRLVHVSHQKASVFQKLLTNNLRVMTGRGFTFREVVHSGAGETFSAILVFDREEQDDAFPE